MTGRFEGKVALVTGAGGGIGLAIARDLAEAGAIVHAFDLKPAPAALAEHDHIVFHQGDLCDGARTAALFSGIEERHGRLDCAVNAAGLCLFERDGSVETVADDVFARTFDVNLTGAMRIVRGALPLMRAAGGGAFVHIASVVGLRTMENILGGGPADAYQLSKAALVSLSRSLALQFAHQNIRSNTVCPGAIATPMTADIYADPARVAAMQARTPLGRVGRPEDVSAATLFLLGDEASFITGTDLVVDGGLLAKL
jgi:NAD(P)-dependent dehydrogenase (short-subunit alcohol dehydrogenase family)